MSEQNTDSIFENKGYFREYYVGDKYIGYVKCEKDRETLGWYGKQTHIAEENIIVGKRTIKKGTEYTTQLQMICGRIKQTSR